MTCKQHYLRVGELADSNCEQILIPEISVIILVEADRVIYMYHCMLAYIADFGPLKLHVIT